MTQNKFEIYFAIDIQKQDIYQRQGKFISYKINKVLK